MTPRLLASALLIVLSATPRSSAQPPPSHQDFRPQTFTRPSPALSEFYYGGGSSGRRTTNTTIVSPFSSAYGSGYPDYRGSLLGGYGASPFDGLKASRTLYAKPFRSLVYPPGLPTQRAGFYETTIPYGDYGLRTRVRSRAYRSPWDLR